MEFYDKILVTGGTGLVGTHLVNALQKQGYDVVAVGSEWDLRQEDHVRTLFSKVQPTIVFHLAAKVGGIYANIHHKTNFYRDNVLINTHVIDQCLAHNVRYCVAMGTGCAYPKSLEQQILYEENFLAGIPEATNNAYAYAKRGLLVHLQAIQEDSETNCLEVSAERSKLPYAYCIPANIYGPYDNFHPTHAHVVPALVRRFCEAVLMQRAHVTIGGNGHAMRDFLYIEDCVEALILLAKQKAEGMYNIATGSLTSIADLGQCIQAASHFSGDIMFDLEFPAGQLQRRFDIQKITQLGWRARTTLTEGIQKTVNWFYEHLESASKIQHNSSTNMRMNVQGVEN